MSAATPTAYWPLPSLLRSLSRAGWGPLAGREYQGIRSTLTALANRLPDKSAEGLSTAEQIAASAGLSERWVRRCLNVLEDLGLITWQRGGVIDGRPAPSLFAVVKTRIVALIDEARGIRRTTEAEHRAATRKRITDAGLTYTMRPRRKKKAAKSRGSSHVELSASLSTPIGGMPLRGGIPTPKDKDQNIMHPEAVTNDWLRQQAHRRLIEKKRRIAEETAIERQVNRDILARRKAAGGVQAVDEKTALIDYALERFKKGKR